MRWIIDIDTQDGMKLLINTLSGAIDVVNKEEFETLRRIQDGCPPERFSADLVHKFRERKYLLSSKHEESAIIDKIDSKMKLWLENRPSNFVLIPSYYCNLACTYCYQGNLTVDRSQMTEKMGDGAFESIHRIVEQERCQNATITIYGGEPLLPVNRNIVRQILGRSKDFGFKVSCITNGSHLDEFAGELAQCDVKVVQVTLDGPKRIHDLRRRYADGTGTFEDILRGIQTAIENEILVVIRVNVDRQNIASLPELGRLISEMGWDESEFIRAYLGLVLPCASRNYALLMNDEEFVDKTIEIFKRYEEMEVFGLVDPQLDYLLSAFHGVSRLPRFWFCGAHMKTYIFDPFGRIYTCLDAVGDERFVVGEYYPELRILEEQLSSWRNRSVLSLPCVNCKYALLCGGGCAYQAFLKHGTINRQHCGFRAVLEKILPLLYEQYNGLFPLVRTKS